MWYSHWQTPSQASRIGSTWRIVTGQSHWKLKTAVFVGGLVVFLPLVALLVALVLGLLVGVLVYALLTLLVDLCRLPGKILGFGSQRSYGISGPSAMAPPDNEGRENVTVIRRE